jgi:hypothetical protein
MADLNARIKPKKSSTTGEVPQAADLEVAEIAVNTADGKLFVKHTDNSVKEVAEQTVTSINDLSDVTTETSSSFTDIGNWSQNVEGSFPSAAGEWRIYSVGSPDVLQFYKENASSVDRSTELLSITSGTQFQWSFDNVAWNTATAVQDTQFSAGGGGNTVLSVYVSDVDGAPIEVPPIGPQALYIRVLDAPVVPIDGQVLTWVDANNQWEPADATGGSATAIDDLTDVDTSTTPPTDGQVLTWVDANSQWEPGDLQGAAVRAALGIGEYADDAAAGTGGVASGAMYYNTTSSDYRLKT